LRAWSVAGVLLSVGAGVGPVRDGVRKGVGRERPPGLRGVVNPAPPPGVAHALRVGAVSMTRTRSKTARAVASMSLPSWASIASASWPSGTVRGGRRRGGDSRRRARRVQGLAPAARRPSTDAQDALDPAARGAGGAVTRRRSRC